MADLAAAIATIEFSRSTHIGWRDLMLANPGDPRGEVAGDAAWHQRAIDEYDNVLLVLAEVGDR